ncbi:MAG: discoidin domain-containing protein [Clostridia bacterium]|nr:discoidin domain-containing protein [Clostridia bacterium]
MKYRLSHEKLASFIGDILPLRLIADEDITKADITWTVSGKCVMLRKFSGIQYSGEAFTDTENDHYRDVQLNDRVLVTFLSEGTAEICAEIEGEKYTCTVTSAARKPLPDTRPNYYIGDLHVHTTMEHDHDRFCAREKELAFDTAKSMYDKNDLDFSVISDHGCCLDDRHFFDGFEVTRGAHDFPILFAGSESEVSHRQDDRYGNRHKNSGEMVVLNSDAFSNSDNWDAFYSELSHSPFAVVTLAHPQIIGSPAGGGGGIWHFSLDKNNTPELKSVLRLIESGNGGDRSSNSINEYMYSVALDKGFRVCLTCSSDIHNEPWGYHAQPGKTVIMAHEKSREAFLYAMRENRVYATESGNVKLYYSVNGITAPCTLDECTNYKFHIELDYFESVPDTVPVKCEVISDYGKCIKSINGSFTAIDFTVESTTARYFYLRLTDCEGRKTWSCPVWTGRDFDKNTKSLPCQYAVGNEENLEPISKKAFTICEKVSGKNCDEIISDDITREWFGDNVTASFVIDMNAEHTIRGVGHYPVQLPQSNAPDTKTKMMGFAAEYEISVSLDGENYEKCADGLIRIYGAEVLATFDAKKARYVKFDVKSTVGKLSGIPKYNNVPVVMNELTIFS